MVCVCVCVCVRHLLRHTAVQDLEEDTQPEEAKKEEGVKKNKKYVSH